jgi:hypothetical protein
MAATRLLGIVVEDVAASIATVAGSTTYTGKIRYPDNQVLQDQIRLLTPETQAYTITWLHIGTRAPVSVTTTLVRTLIFIKLPKDTSSTCEKMYDFLDKIVTAVTQDANYRNAVIPLEATLVREDDELQDSVAIWRLDVDVQMPLSCP